MRGLPVEILLEIIGYLPQRHRKSVSLASQQMRRLTLPFIFGRLRITRYDISTKMRKIYEARDDTKEAIRQLELYYWANADEVSILFDLLKTLPNLRVLKYRHFGEDFYHQDAWRLITSIQHTPLREFSFAFEGNPDGCSVSVCGLEGLSLTWNTDDPNSSLARLYPLFRSTLTTLVELKIDLPRLGQGLELLRPAGVTLRHFTCNLVDNDEGILDLIPEIFPALASLSIVSRGESHSVLWKDAHIDALSRIVNLTNLTLSSDFECLAHDIRRADVDYAWYIRCYKRRLAATQDLAAVCLQLQRCNWKHYTHRDSRMIHPFIVEERVDHDHERTRVVRGVKQNWMGQDQPDWITGGIVPCKLEDLPGDIVVLPRPNLAM